MIWQKKYLYPPKEMLNVSKSQKQILKFSFEPKVERKYILYFCPSSLQWVKSKNKMQFIILDDKSHLAWADFKIKIE